MDDLSFRLGDHGRYLPMLMDPNPYESPSVESVEMVDTARARDQCPKCNRRQDLWRAINVAWRYQCPKCGVRLTVELSRKLAVRMMLAMLVLLGVPVICTLWISNPMDIWLPVTIFAPLLVAIQLWIRWRYGRLTAR